MRCAPALLLLIPVLLFADDDTQHILHEIGRSVKDAIIKSDNYICEQDLARFYYVPVSPEIACHQPPVLPNIPLHVQDRLKLDVAVSSGGEIYSWHGEKRFSASTLKDVVSDGPISSGGFSGYLRNIFGERGVLFTFRGRLQADGLELFLFDYKVSLASSHYEVEAVNGEELASFHGSFTARVDNFELHSLTVTADGETLSPKTNICSAETKLIYQSAKIADHESVLPASFNLLMAGRNGTFTESKASFTSCHEYRGESTVSFDVDDKPTASSQPLELSSTVVPAGLILRINLATDIDEDTAYSGLPVDAILRNDIKLKNGEKILHGAQLHGTLTKFIIIYKPEHEVDLTIKFNSVISGNKVYLCEAMHHFVPGFVPGYPSGGGRGRGRGIGSVAPAIQARGNGDEAEGALLFQVKHLHIGRSYSSEFITVNGPAS